tara:strand:+ start:2176 stop:2652 length:477 start_codon:yes stop_codon:yes gene_type:complete
MSSYSSYEEDKKRFDGWRGFLTEQENVEINTWGQLRKTVKGIVMRDKVEGVAKVGLDVLADAIPGGGTVKKAWDLFKALYSAPDSKKTNTKLDKINIDDEYSAIVDDTIEDDFLKILVASIEKEPENQQIPDDWDISTQLEDYISKKYGDRTVSGYQK